MKTTTKYDVLKHVYKITSYFVSTLTHSNINFDSHLIDCDPNITTHIRKEQRLWILF